MDRSSNTDASSEAADAEYLSRCQVDTPPDIVELVWQLVNERRPDAGSVVDYGCGDGRFSTRGTYSSYQGFEIDPKRAPKSKQPPRPHVRVACAFARRNDRGSFSTSVQNPPYVRHHELTLAWIARAERRLSLIDGYEADGRANAYVYFMWLGIDAVVDDGLAAFVVPYEWVSRPAARHLREYLAEKRWGVDVYRLSDNTFDRVLTTACITIIDKRVVRDEWRIFDFKTANAPPLAARNITFSDKERLKYERADDREIARANRGLSPGGQDFFLLTEAERIHHRLVRGRDVLPAVASFRHLTAKQVGLTEALFRSDFVDRGRRCWLINPVGKPSQALAAYLASASEKTLNCYTCINRAEWWRFNLPSPVEILYASGFKGSRPKFFANDVRAIHVGSVHGIYLSEKRITRDLLEKLREIEISDQIIPLAKGFMKVEVNQMNGILNQLIRERGEPTHEVKGRQASR